MTDKTELRHLIEAVEADAFDAKDWWQDLRVMFPMSTQEVSAGDYESDQVAYIRAAYHGSLDAAKALHEVLLPGWAREIWSAQGEDADAKVYPPLATGQEFTGRTEGIDVFSAEVDGDNPARAWLISILKAYEAQQ